MIPKRPDFPRERKPPHEPPEPWSADDFQPIAELLKRRHYESLTPHRLNLLQARLQVRLRAQGIPSFTHFYQSTLNGHAGGRNMQLLIDLSTVNHSSFFREPAPLAWLAERLVAQIRAQPYSPLRVWSAGCSAGQEPYTLAMLLAEPFSSGLPERVEIYASDVSREMVETAARAIFEKRELAEVAPERLRRFFLRGHHRQAGYFRIVPELRQRVRFLHFDLRSADWPVPDQLDAILCRNVLLYFSEEERPEVLDRLAGQLRPGGWLVVGNCEILPDRPGLLVKDGPSTFRKVATT